MQEGVLVDDVDTLGMAKRDEAMVRRKAAAELALMNTSYVQTFASDAAYQLNQSVLNESAEGIYGLNRQGITTFVNPAAYRLTGWTAEDLKGRTQHNMVHHSRHDGSHYPLEECPIYKALREGVQQQRDDEVFWRKDGTCFPVAYTATPVLRHGKPYGAVIVFCDTTLRVQEEAWQESKARVINSLRERAPLADTAARIADAFSIFIGAQRAQRGRGIVRHPQKVPEKAHKGASR